MDKLRSLLLYLIHKVNDNKCYFLKMGQSRRPLFVYFRLFLITIQILNCKSKDGDRTRARSIVGADGSTELWLPDIYQSFFLLAGPSQDVFLLPHIP